MEPLVVLIAISTLVLVVVAMMGIRIIRPWEKGLIERLGKYMRTIDSGLHIIIPFLDTLHRVDMREQVIDVPPQAVITKDNVVVTVDAVIYLEVVDPFNFQYNVSNFWAAVTKLAQTNLRNVVGDMSLDESLVSRDQINLARRQVLDTATDKWGTRVTRVEIQRIEPPADVTHAMHRQMKAERERRAVILEAEGAKRSQVLAAEGNKEAQIRRAEGEAEAIRAVADAEKYKLQAVAKGEALAIEGVYKAIHNGNPTPDLIAIKYLESLAKIADGQATKLFLPLETSGILGSVGSIGELFDKKLSNPSQHTLTE